MMRNIYDMVTVNRQEFEGLERISMWFHNEILRAYLKDKSGAFSVNYDLIEDICKILREHQPSSQPTLAQRIDAYLGNGGLFNPELANHDAVRDLLIDLRKVI